MLMYHRVITHVVLRWQELSMNKPPNKCLQVITKKLIFCFSIPQIYCTQLHTLLKKSIYSQ
jgi:hypothetical protein